MIGLRINNYEIVSLLGEGGMGAVYLAQHPVMGRKVAVKLLRRELAEDATLVARFINEARAATAIRHPNIIDVLDVGTLPEQGVPYIMMEFLDGESLAARLDRRGKLDVAEAVDIAIQTASALGAAHAKGIVHRDLKPDNLFLVADEMQPGRERVKVLDFGIAKLRGEIGSGSVKTNAGSIMGTPPYMSPEQCRGIVEEVDHRTDVYALGIILYAMLCGGPPFVSAGYGEVLIMHIMQQPPAPRGKNPEIPEALERAMLHALAKQREERIASMADFQAALMRVPTALGPGGGARVLTREPTPVEVAPTMARTPLPPTSVLPPSRAPFVGTPMPVAGPRIDDPATRPPTTFSATARSLPAVRSDSRRARRAVLAVAAGAALVVGAGVAIRAMSGAKGTATGVSAPSSGAATVEAPPASVPTAAAPAPVAPPAPVSAPAPAAVPDPAVVAPAATSGLDKDPAAEVSGTGRAAEVARRNKKLSGGRRVKNPPPAGPTETGEPAHAAAPAAHAAAPPRVVVSPTVPSAPPAPPVGAPPAPAKKGPAEKW